MLNLKEQKQQLRQRMLALRQSRRDANAAAALKIQNNFLAHISLPKSSVIASYRCFRDEVDVSGLTEILRAQGHHITLPIITARNQALRFHEHHKTVALIKNAIGIEQPSADSPARDPDILLIPLLAFDDRRNRLGYGGGYYDRTLAALRKRKHIKTIGIAYDYQEAAVVPTDAYDYALDHIVTDIKVF